MAYRWAGRRQCVPGGTDATVLVLGSTAAQTRAPCDTHAIPPSTRFRNHGPCRTRPNDSGRGHCGLVLGGQRECLHGLCCHHPCARQRDHHYFSSVCARSISEGSATWKRVIAATFAGRHDRLEGIAGKVCRGTPVRRVRRKEAEGRVHRGAVAAGGGGTNLP